MEADRVVERPEDPKEKKPGKFSLFGRKGTSHKKSSQLSSTYNSSSTTFPPTMGRGSSEASAPGVDEDQPPRLDSPQNDNLKSTESTVGAPLRAGFDFEAINSVLAEVRTSHNQGGASDSQEPDISVLSTPVRRAESTPLPTSPGRLFQASIAATENETFDEIKLTHSTLGVNLESSVSVREDGDIGDIGFTARPPRAPSIPFTQENNAMVWTNDHDVPTPPPKDSRLGLAVVSREGEAEDGDISTGRAWKPPLASKPTFFNNPWET